MRVAWTGFCLRSIYLTLGIVAFCTVLALAMLGIVWAGLGDEPARASRWMSTLLGREVQVSGIEVRWQGLGPKLRLSEVRIMDPETEHPLLSFKEAYLGAASYRAMLAGEWVPRHLIVVGGKLTVERKAAGCMRIFGLQNEDVACSDSSHFPAWLFKFTRLTLVDTEIEWIDPLLESAPLHLQVTELHLFNEGDRHRLAGEAVLPEDFGDVAVLRAEFTGRGFHAPDSHGFLHLAGKGLHLGRWARGSFFSELSLVRGSGNLQVKLRWGKTAVPEMIATFTGKNIVLAGTAGQVPIPYLSGTGRYQSLENGWDLEVPRLFVIGARGAWPMTALQLRARRSPTPSLYGEFQLLRLQDIAALAQLSQRIDSRLLRFLEETRPQGELHNLTFFLPLAEEHAAHWRVSARGAKVEFQPWQRWPGGQGLAFALQFTSKEGQLKIYSREARLLSATGRKPVDLGTLRGKVTWRRDNQGWQLLANSRLENRDLALGMTWRLRNSTPADTPYLDLVLTLERMELASLSRYLSLYASKVHLNLIRWLEQAFSAGQAVGGGVVFQGPWREFLAPRKNSSRFIADLGIRGATLNYASGWPVLDAVDAYLHSDGQTVTTRVVRGQLFHSQVISAVTRINGLGLKAPSLVVRGQVRGDVGDAQHFIQQSPLQKHYGGFLQGMELRGDTRLDLKLEVPLGDKKKPPLVSGELVFAKANVRQQHSPFLEFTEIEGKLHFTQAEIEAKGLAARFLEQPIVVDLQNRPKAEQEAGAQLRIRGSMRASSVAEKWFPGLSPWLAGRADFTAKVGFQKVPAKGGKLASIQVNSDLEGVGITLPPPLAKPAGQVQKLTGEIRKIGEGKWRIRGAYGQGLHSLFEVQEDEQSFDILRGEVRAGKAAALPEQGIRVRGALPAVSLSAWQDVLTLGALGDFGGGKISSPAVHIALQIGQLELLGQHFEKVALEANRISSLWQVQVTAPSVRGKMAIPAEETPGLVEVDLDYLHMSSWAGVGLPSLVHPQGWPTFNLHCRQFKYNGYELGALKARLSGRGNGVHLERLEIMAPAIQLYGQGDWSAHGDTQWSHLDLKASSSNLGQVLADFGYPTNLVGGKTEVEVVAGWRGSPSQFHLNRVEGNVRFRMDKGRLLNVEPGAGRLFGLLSISALPRRLALDFSDIFSKGLAFDRIKGDFSLHKGDAFSNELVMKGPTALIRAQGRIGLIAQDYDQIIAVTPNIFSSLPLAGVMAGGPVGFGVGTALMLADRFADKIFGAPVGRLITYHYQMSGSWTEPAVTRIRKVPSRE